MNAHTPFHAAPKALPSDVGAEQALLGTILYDWAVWERIPDGLKAEHFFEPVNGRILDAAAALLSSGRGIDAALVYDRMKGDVGLDELGGMHYLVAMVADCPPSTVAPEYAGIVRRLAMRRELIRISDELGAAAELDAETDPKVMVEAAEGQLYALAEPTANAGGFQAFSTALQAAFDSYAAAHQRGGGVSGLSTGLIDLDHRLGGLHPSDLTILAGRPSMGKTALATNIAFSIAKTGRSVGFFSLEMSAEQLSGRLLAEVSGVSSDRLRKGLADSNELRRVREAVDEIQAHPLHIDDTGGLPIAKLCARARRLKRQKGLDLIVVDYLQLVTSPDLKGQGRVQEVSAITAGLKALAKELSVPVLALSQLSRQVESREDKRPQLSDLRESGSIEQDADAVLFVYREAYYKGRAEPRENTPEHQAWEDEMAQIANLAEVIVGKQRHGPIGTVKLHFNEDLTKFSNLAREDRYEVRQSAARLPYGRDD